MGVRLLPLAVDAELRPRARAALLRLRLHELYGRPHAGRRHEPHRRTRSRRPPRHPAPPLHFQRLRARLRHSAVQLVQTQPEEGGTRAWPQFGVDGEGEEADGARAWDLRVRVRFRGGAYREVTAQARAGAGLPRRRAVMSARHAVVLVQPYTTHSGALALRVAPGLPEAMSVARDRLRRLLHCH
ncbi:hypothetical protein EAO75_34350 [Streptomyces sp. uw30]|uniref:hypothetical protein n=1 Tax=Streptomyces sp. uw30 TaxID=1828179 RepID=UPI0011CE828D|nr:hypothetical protein [Streptomyces sp. uw30]TXS41896.1 hypothetical protein EAO75_34350 [Streptomyces sp. uw30]